MTEPDENADGKNEQAARADQSLGAPSITDPYKVLGDLSDVDGIGVLGRSTATSGAGRGVEGYTDADGSGTDQKPVGVYGESTATDTETNQIGETYGVYGLTKANGEAGSLFPAGVKGEATGNGSNRGVDGVTFGVNSDAAGVYGRGDTVSEFSLASGVFGETYAYNTGAAGVEGVAQANSGETYGVRGKTTSGNANAAGVYGETTGGGYGVHSAGDAKVTGSLEVGKIGASVYLSSSQSVGDLYETVQFDGVVRDDRSEWNPNGNYHFVCASDGDYHVETSVRFDSTPAQDTELELFVRVDGTGKAWTVERVGWTDGGRYSIDLCKTLFGLTAGQEVWIETLQGDGVTDYPLGTGQSSTYLTVRKVG